MRERVAAQFRRLACGFPVEKRRLGFDMRSLAQTSEPDAETLERWRSPATISAAALKPVGECPTSSPPILAKVRSRQTPAQQREQASIMAVALAQPHRQGSRDPKAGEPPLGGLQAPAAAG